MFRAVAIACAVILVTYVTIFAVPPLIPTLVDELSISHARAGLLMTAFTAAYCVGSLPAGRLADRRGAGRAMAAGAIIVGVASLLFAISTAFPLLLALRFVLGLGNSLVWTAGVIYVAQSVAPERVSAGVGWFTGALSGGIATAYLLTPLLDDAIGWRGITALYGAVALAVGVVASLALRGNRGVGVGQAGVPLATLARNRPLMTVAIALFLAAGTLYGILTWTPPFMEDVGGFSASKRSLAGLVIAAAAIPGSIAAGALATRTGRLALTYAVFLAPALACIAIAAGSEGYVAVTAVAVTASFGATGALIPMFAAAPALVPAEAAGAAGGFATAVGIAGTVVATYLGGLLVESAGYRTAFFAFALLAAAGVALAGPATARALRP